MQEFLVYTVDHSPHLGTSLYNAHLREQERVVPKVKVITKQHQQQQPRFKIVNEPPSYTSATPSPVSSSPSQHNPDSEKEEHLPRYDCGHFHTAKGCKYGTRENPELCRWLHSAAVGRSLSFMDEQGSRDKVSEPLAKRLRLQASTQGKASCCSR
jgi:hypothetical protein